MCEKKGTVVYKKNFQLLKNSMKEIHPFPKIDAKIEYTRQNTIKAYK